MTLVYVKNTFIEAVQDPDEASSCLSLLPPPTAAKRSSSAPPKMVEEERDHQGLELKLKADYCCVTPDILSARSDYSTTASSSGMHPHRIVAPASDSDSATDTSTPGFQDAKASSERKTLWSLVEPCDEGSTPETTDTEDQTVKADPEDCIGTEELRDFSITLNKADGATLGIDVDRSDGITLYIRSVTPGGLVERWSKANPELAVMEGDRIVKVNSISGSALELLRECRRRDVLQMRVLRNARPELLAALVAAFCAAATMPSGTPTAGRQSKKASGPAASEIQRSARGKKQNLRLEAAVSDDSRCGTCGSGDWASKKEVSMPRTAPMAPLVDGQRPMLNVQAQAFNPLPAINHGACSEAFMEVSGMLRSAAHALSFDPKVKSVHMVEGTMGSSSAINIELQPACGSDILMGVSALAKSTLLDAAAASQNTYIVGYLETPFYAVGENAFRATVAKVPDSDSACWDFYQKGFCPRPSSCRWCHPSAADLMTVWVNLK